MNPIQGSGPKIGLVAHDAGGARALAPVVAEILAKGVRPLPILAGPAVAVWREEFPEMPVEGFTDEATEEELGGIMRDRGARLLFSAAGLYNQIEHRARRAARRLGLPVVALMDAWLNEGQRFERSRGDRTEESRPDRICAIDEYSRRKLLAAGFPSSAVVLTGHPDLERTMRQCTAVSAEERRRLLEQMRAATDALVVVFFSDPFFIGPDRQFYCGPGAIMKPDGRGLYGYTVEDVLPRLLIALDQALEQAGRDGWLVVKPHPMEDQGVLERLVAGFPGRRLRIEIKREGRANRWIGIADVVVGMMSIALLHGALAGKPVLSLQPGLPESGQPDPCMASVLGWATRVSDFGGLNELCERAVSGELTSNTAAREGVSVHRGATRRVAEVLLECWQPA